MKHLSIILFILTIGLSNIYSQQLTMYESIFCNEASMVEYTNSKGIKEPIVFFRDSTATEEIPTVSYYTEPYYIMNTSKGELDLSGHFEETTQITGFEKDFLNQEMKEINSTPETFFLAQQCYTFNGLGSWWQQGFTIYQTTTFVIRFSAQFNADAAVFPASQMNNFQNNQTFSGWGNFDNQIGYHTITLSAGDYYLGMRNQISGSNSCAIELDFDIDLPSSDNCTFYDYYVNGVENISGGGKLWQQFTIQSGFRYFLDGCNSGLEVFIIPENELSHFQNNQSFQYYTDYAQSQCGMGPGFFEITLSPATYYMVARNTSAQNHSINYLMERWRKNSNSAIDEFSENKNIIVYPNPMKDKFIIEFNDCVNNTFPAEIIVYNIQGQILLRKTIITTLTEIDVSHFTKGIYALNISNSKGSETIRLLKE